MRYRDAAIRMKGSSCRTRRACGFRDELGGGRCGLRRGTESAHNAQLLGDQKIKEPLTVRIVEILPKPPDKVIRDEGDEGRGVASSDQADSGHTLHVLDRRRRDVRRKLSTRLMFTLLLRESGPMWGRHSLERTPSRGLFPVLFGKRCSWSTKCMGQRPPNQQCSAHLVQPSRPS
jgi:hypothetical protein